MSVATQAPAELFYFGPPQRQLFGALDEAQTFDQRACGVVLCYPYGYEYIRSHRAFRHLALRLAQAGFPVLRFDYGGTGDSAGDAEGATLAGWQDDIRRAIETLQDRTGVDTVCLAGLRLGASLALEVSAERADVAALILWEPLVTGASYLAELAGQHQELVWRFFDDGGRLSAGASDELLGFPFSAALRAELERLDLATRTPAHVDATLIVERRAAPESRLLIEQLSGSGGVVTHELIPSFAVWREDVDKGLVPDPVLRAIAAWAEEALP